MSKDNLEKARQKHRDAISSIAQVEDEATREVLYHLASEIDDLCEVIAWLTEIRSVP